jgi:type II secretory pathway component PulC
VLLFVALSGSIAAAEDAKPAEPKPEVAKSKVPLRVVKILPETDQALLIDTNRGTHVLAEVGASIAGYVVKDIDDDEVTLESSGGTQVVLAAPARAVERKAKPVVVAKAPAAPAEPQPIDPYADQTQPVDPYAAAEPTRAAPAPDEPVRVAEAPVAPQAPAEVAAPAPAAPAPVAAVDAPVVLARADVHAALSNFSKLSASLRATFTPAGARLEAVADGSLFARAGLHAGDVVTAVDNQPMHSLDDAATLYARAASARNVTLHVLRADKPITLHVAIL